MWAAEAPGPNDHKPLPATEIIAFQELYSGSLAYGKAKWSGAYPDLVAGRALAEENVDIVSDRAIPNMMLLISGARVDKDVTARIQEQFRNRDKKSKQVLILNAYSSAKTPTTPTATPTIAVERTRDLQNTDGLGIEYTKTIDSRVRRAYRLPSVAMGDADGMTKEAAYAMFRFTEDQVYDPDRTDVADVINNTIIKDLDILYWKYKVNTRTPKDPELLGKLVDTLSRAGVITPSEGREIAESIFNKRFHDPLSGWASIPLGILLAILQTKNHLTAGAIVGSDGAEGAQDLMEKIREALLGQIEQVAGEAGNINPPTEEIEVQDE
jgi:capsid portal protein